MLAVFVAGRSVSLASSVRASLMMQSTRGESYLRQAVKFAAAPPPEMDGSLRRLFSTLR